MRTLILILTWSVILGSILIVGMMFFKFTRSVVIDLPRVPLTQKAFESKLAKESKSLKNLQFDLVDPEEAPAELRQAVERGFNLMLHTHEILPQYVGDHLDCANCHFGGGITTGGVSGGISLAGVAAQYPRYNSSTKSIEDLPMRINSCFRNSMNGKPLPLESQEMLSLVTYLHWISARFPIYGGAPWLGLKLLRSSHVPDPVNGQTLYITICADCHGKDGQGGNASPAHPGIAIPPLWGDYSFNKSAGMNRPEIFASFIYHNMPYEEPGLTSTQALDITAFVLSQPRSIRKD